MIGEGKIRKVLISRRNPAVTNEETLEIPRSLILVRISFQDSASNVRNVLSSVGFAGDIELSWLAIIRKLYCLATYVVVLVLWEEREPLL